MRAFPVLCLAISLVCRAAGGPCADGGGVAVFAKQVAEHARRGGISVRQAAEAFRSAGIAGFDCHYREKTVGELVAGGLRPANFYGDMKFLAPDGGVAQTEEFIAAAVRYGVPRVMILPDEFTGNGDEADFARIVSGVRMFVSRATARGLEVTTEDYGYFRTHQNPCGHVAYIRRLLKAVPALRLTLDSGNLHRTEGREAILGLLREEKDRVSHVHLKDLGAQDASGRCPHVTLGGGEVPNMGIVALLRESGYRGWYTLENLVGEDLLADAKRQLTTLRGWLDGKGLAPGLSRRYVFDQPTRTPVVFGGWSKAENAQADDYCIWLDIHYDNGEAVWGRKAPFTPGTHGWEESRGVFVPTRPIRKIGMSVLYRNGAGRPNPGGTVEFRDVFLERREGKGERFPLCRLTDRPFSNADEFSEDVLQGGTVKREKRLVPRTDEMVSPVRSGQVEIWTADSMERVTPLTFPRPGCSRKIALSLAKRERESAQVLLSAAADVEWTSAELEMPVLKSKSGGILRGTVTWQRQGYLAREYGANPHPFTFPKEEKWFPDPLLPPAPMRVRKASTQGAWITVHAEPDAEAGTYAGEILVKERGTVRGRVPVTVKVEPFALPKTFGLETAYALMDGFLRALYPDDFKAKKREAIDIMLDHRLNPDDISRTTPPDIDDLLYARERGMNRFNILNVVPPPKDPKARWVLVAEPEEIFNDAFYDSFMGVVKPYVEELRRYGLDRMAYVYGFDERTKEFYPGIDDFWKKMKRDIPGIPLMTTAKNYKDYVAGQTNLPGVVTGDWYCPTTRAYDSAASDRLRAMGKKVWWYVCCSPYHPYANFSSWEYPPIEGRLLGWMTWRWRADGFLFWIVNKWHGNAKFSEDVTYFPHYSTYNGNGMPGDGIMLFPGERHILPSIRLAQCRDAVEDYEYLQAVAQRIGRKAADDACDEIITSLTGYSRDPGAIRAVRRKLARCLVP